jgi:hypothetical protein
VVSKSRNSTRIIANVPFEVLTGLKAFVVANALSDIGAPKQRRPRARGENPDAPDR